MKQELDLSTLLEPSESSSSKKGKTERKRPIKKDSTAAELQRQKKLARQAKRKLSKEEKVRLQKEKNRFHAQKSRDEHRQYVNSLERQVLMLKQELERSKHYCCSCKQLINSCLQKQDQVQPMINLEHFSGDEINWKQENFDMNEAITNKVDSASFLRLFDEKQDHHLLKMVLFITAIVIAVLFVNGPQKDQKLMFASIQTYSISQNLESIFQSNDTLQHSLISQEGQENNQSLHSNEIPFIDDSSMGEKKGGQQKVNGFDQSYTGILQQEVQREKMEDIDEEINLDNEGNQHIFIDGLLK